MAPSTAALPAARAVASVIGCPRSAASAPFARQGMGAAAPRITAARVHRPCDVSSAIPARDCSVPLISVTVPAMPSLWSDWDVALHHYRRYRHQRLLKLFDATLFEITYWNYINVVALPAVFAARKLRPVLRSAARDKSNRRLEDKMLPSWLDSGLSFAFKALACQSRIRFPAGVSLLAIAKRR